MSHTTLSDQQALDRVAKLAASAKLLVFRVATWNARVVDKPATSEILVTKRATKGSGTFTKFLFKGSHGEFSKVTAAGTAISTYGYANTLPYSTAAEGQIKTGDRIILTAGGSTEDLCTFIKTMQGLRIAYDKAADYFVDHAYDDAIARAALSDPVGLGDLFNPNDYPSKSELRSRYSSHVDYLDVPVSGANMPQLPQEVVDALMIDAADTARAQLANAHADLMKKAFVQLESMATVFSKKADDKLKGAGRVHDTMPDRMRALTGLLKGGNVYEDPELDEIASMLEEKFLNIPLQDLKANVGNICQELGELSQGAYLKVKAKMAELEGKGCEVAATPAPTVVITKPHKPKSTQPAIPGLDVDDLFGDESDGLAF